MTSRNRVYACLIGAAVSAALTGFPGVLLATMLTDDSSVSIDNILLWLILPMALGIAVGFVVWERLLAHLRQVPTDSRRPTVFGAFACLSVPLASALLAVWLIIAPVLFVLFHPFGDPSGIRLARHSDAYSCYSDWIWQCIVGKRVSPRRLLTITTVVLPPIVLTPSAPTNTDWGVSLLDTAPDGTVRICLHKTGEILKATTGASFRTERGREMQIWLDACENGGQRVVLGGRKCFYGSDVSDRPEKNGYDAEPQRPAEPSSAGAPEGR